MTHLLRIPVRCTGSILLLLAAGASVMTSGCAPAVKPVSKALSTPTTLTSLSPQEQIHQLALQASGRLLKSLQVVYSQTTESAEITGTLAGAVPRSPSQISAAQEQVKVLCFEIERALWTSSIHLHDVFVIILGPVLDDYYDRTIDWYGTADLTNSNAVKLSWGKLSADAAWNLFARTALRMDYVPFEDYDAPTPSPTSGA
jgi:hypothetical protein